MCVCVCVYAYIHTYIVFYLCFVLFDYQVFVVMMKMMRMLTTSL